MKIGLFYSTTGNNNGPGKVVSNLVKGLEMCNVEVIHNQIGDVNGCLQSWGTPLSNLSTETVVGPNLFVLPIEMPWVFTKYHNMVVPSSWVKDKYQSFDCVKNGVTKICVWPVGIDTDRFCPSEDKKEWDVLLYVKNRQPEVASIVCSLKELGLSVVVLGYGSYTEEELISVARKSKCCILLTKTESQGIAYQEILSMGVPCYVLDKDVWDDYSGWSFSATSVPYFNDQCGVIGKDMTKFSEFYENFKNYNPRKYILDSLGLKKQSIEYIDILTKRI